ncbi:MAG TPA: hypothetical protein VJ583_03010 [Nitrososphaeraceae archaeon]|jgi:hypothetical protein|nr:hypothetical protein [Nitrososphaeraceae archaeon]
MQDNSISLIVYYEIPEKNLIVYGMVFPFLTSIAVVLMILDDQKL